MFNIFRAFADIPIIGDLVKLGKLDVDKSLDEANTTMMYVRYFLIFAAVVMVIMLAVYLWNSRKKK